MLDKIIKTDRYISENSLILYLEDLINLEKSRTDLGNWGEEKQAGYIKAIENIIIAIKK